MIGLASDWTDNDGIYDATFARKEHLLEALERVHLEGGSVLDVTAEEGSLEDYFVKTIGRAA